MPFGLKLLKEKEFTDLNNKSVSLEKKVSNLETALINRPVIDFLAEDNFSAKYPKYPIPQQALYSIFHVSDTWKNIVGSLRFEIFRNGINFSGKFESKCINENCGKEFDYEISKCTECG